MKQLFLILALALVCYGAYAQSPFYTTSGYGASYIADGAYLGWNISGGGGETNFVNNIGGGTTGGFTFDNTTRSNVTTRLMTILGNGNVSIGTTNLGFKLGIKGSDMGTLGLSVPGSVQGERSAVSFFSTFQNTPDNGPRRTSDIVAGFNGGAWGNEYLSFNVGYNGSANDGALPTLEKMRITGAGKVGIGTTNPDELLSVNGTIHSKEVKVNLTGLPDYVFKPTYRLPSLAEVKSYIDKNQHLPEVPSATEVEENGLNLGEMNKLLLKKVEELTLYLIEENKAKQAQQKEIDLLKQQLAALTKAISKTK